MSCAFGAIRGDWYGWKDLAAHECRDGCAAKGTCAGCEDGMPEPSPAASLQAGSATER